MDKEFTGNYFQWLIYELKNGFTKTGAVIWLIGFVLETYQLAIHPITSIGAVTYVASLLGLLCCVYMMSGSAINGVLGIISAIGFIVVNFYAGHWWSVLDQLVFIVLIDLPLLKTWRTWGVNFESKVKTLSKKGWSYTILAILIGWGILTFFAFALHDTNPVWDALVLSVGGVASWLCYHHYNNTYDLWIIEDIANVILWASAFFHNPTVTAIPMFVVTSLYFATAIYGKFFSKWKKAN